MLFFYVLFNLFGVIVIGEKLDVGFDWKKLNFFVNLFGINFLSDMLLINIISWMCFEVCLGVYVIGILLVIIVILFLKLIF